MIPVLSGEAVPYPGSDVGEDIAAVELWAVDAIASLGAPVGSEPEVSGVATVNPESFSVGELGLPADFSAWLSPHNCAHWFSFCVAWFMACCQVRSSRVVYIVWPSSSQK
ncbi:hypothetical protein [Corynebacterium amycolatum]|uniref:hypothetical protein n=1 Tax=Corynebacterium amycolatum TaxID=43765 RepID=UPI002549C856|nr:hypothetical protein [Corynebacterium amycolatum]MDK8726766.1 hypothetical protein [Corynebacterium amycolatum]